MSTDSSGEQPPEGEQHSEELAKVLQEIIRLQNERPRVADDLLLLFGRIAGMVLLAIVIMSMIIVLFYPETDISDLATVLNTQLSLIIGAVLGWAAHPSEKKSD